MKNRVKAPYVRENDSFMTALCLYMTAVFSRPISTKNAVLTVLSIVIGLILLMGLANSLVPFWVAIGIAAMISILASVGAFVRNKRM